MRGLGFLFPSFHGQCIDCVDILHVFMIGMANSRSDLSTGINCPGTLWSLRVIQKPSRCGPGNLALVPEVGWTKGPLEGPRPFCDSVTQTVQ